MTFPRQALHCSPWSYFNRCELTLFSKVNLEGSSGSLEAPATMSAIEKLQRLQLLNGKLHLSLKRLYALHRERTRLQHRVRLSSMSLKCQAYLFIRK